MRLGFLTGVTLLIAWLPTFAISATVPGAPTCPVFPADNAWNEDVSALPVATDSKTLIAAIGIDRSLHPDFSNRGGYGIPFNIVRKTQKKVRVRFQYAGESDRAPTPSPPAPGWKAEATGTS